MLDDTENKHDSVLSNAQQESQHQISIVPPESTLKSTLKIKKKVITEEYKLAGQVLGIGINGKVWEIFQKKSGKNYALKVMIFINPFKILFEKVCLFACFITKIIFKFLKQIK